MTVHRKFQVAFQGSLTSRIVGALRIEMLESGGPSSNKEVVPLLYNSTIVTIMVVHLATISNPSYRWASATPRINARRTVYRYKIY